jgi:hypothetical protein
VDRTSDQTIYAWFWNASTAAYIWNHLADTLIERGDRGDEDDSGELGARGNSLLESAWYSRC